MRRWGLDGRERLAGIEETVREQARGTMLETIGYRLLEVNEQHALAEMDFRPALAQFTGLFHAGALLALADSTATAACMYAVDPEGGFDPATFPLAIQISANLIRNTGEGAAVAEARLIHRGRTTMVAETVVRDRRGRMLAAVTSTHLVLGHPKGGTDVTANPLVTELARLPERLGALLEGHTEEALQRRPGPDAWSAKEIAVHLRDAARIYHERLFLAAAHDRPFLHAYDEAALARDADYQHADTAAIVPDLRSWREETVDLLAGLPPEGWERTAIHEESGEMSVAQLAAHMVEHEAGHLRDLARLLEGA